MCEVFEVTYVVFFLSCTLMILDYALWYCTRSRLMMLFLSYGRALILRINVLVNCYSEFEEL